MRLGSRISVVGVLEVADWMTDATDLPIALAVGFVALATIAVLHIMKRQQDDAPIAAEPVAAGALARRDATGRGDVAALQSACANHAPRIDPASQRAPAFGRRT
jgi:hypothetical protein